VGSQVLSCSFGTISASQGFTIGLLSAGSSIGTYTDTATAVIGSQQILSIGTLTVQGVSAAFTGLTPSQTISYATSSVNLSGGHTTVGDAVHHHLQLCG
jgi:Na+/glutamate symporter